MPFGRFFALSAGTAKANGIESYAYLRHVFTELPKVTTVEDVEALLPWNLAKESVILWSLLALGGFWSGYK